MIAKFRRIAAGSYVNDASGVTIRQGESGNWFVYTVVPGFQHDNLAASRATLAAAKVAAQVEIERLAARREAGHAEALAENFLRHLLRVATGEPEQVRAWTTRHHLSVDGTMSEYGEFLAAHDADHTEAMEYDSYCTELRTELGKFARGEEPYPHEPDPTVVITTPLTHAKTVDDLRTYAQEHGVPYDRLEFAVMAVTGVTAAGAVDLIFAKSTASLADNEPRKYMSRSCCASTESDVHDRTCRTNEARREWLPRSAR